MIRLLKHHQLDFDKYDLCIAMDKSGLPYGYSWYLNAICEWDVLVKNDYDAVWPVPFNKKLGQRYYYRPFGVQQLGIFSKKDLEDKDYEQFTKAFTNTCTYADVYLNEHQLPGAFAKVKFAAFPNYTLSLNRSYENLYSKFSKSLKRNLKKTGQQNFEIFLNDSPNLVINFFKENKGSELALSATFYSNMERLMFLLLHKNQGKIYSVYGGANELLACAFLIQIGARHVLLFSGVSENGRQLSAMHYLINEYIIYYSSKPVLLDFEGSGIPGIASFYASFGSTKSTYQRVIYNNLPFYLRWAKK